MNTRKPTTSTLPAAGAALAPRRALRPTLHSPLSTLHSLRRRGAAAVLAMMFLVIFGSLAAAMAIVAQGNLATADSHLKINRSLAAAETGLQFVTYRLNQVCATVRTRAGLIDASNAPALWLQVRDGLADTFAGEPHNLAPPLKDGDGLTVGPIAVGPGAPRFTATFTPHPIAGENYDSAYYQRAPYNQMSPAVSSANPLDATWVRVRVEAADGPAATAITRAIQVDFHMDKKIRFAILSRSRVMIGRNVLIDGPVGSRFTETNLPGGHPVQMVSDFRGLHADLNAQLDLLANTLSTNDVDGDNRLRLADAREVAGIDNPAQYDADHDGYLDDYDFFFAFYDQNGDGQVTGLELDTANNISTLQLLTLIDTMGDPARPGYGDGAIDARDRYAKIRGEVLLTADKAGWQNGAAGGMYQNYFQGAIHPGYEEAPLTFQASDASVGTFGPADFDVSSFRTMASGDLAAQAAAEAARYDPGDPTSPRPLGATVTESVPYGAAHPYDYYTRPVYENMTFTDVTIPKGANALFKNCTFVGCTFVETTTGNTDPNFNAAGTQEANGALKYPGVTANVGEVTTADTKPLANNLRFDGCTFEGAVVSDAPSAYTHVRNKIAFTGRTRFIVADSQNLTAAQKALFRRSTILTPHYSVEMGTFVNPADANETVELSGTIVAGVIDMRGQVKINGTLLTTFEPVSGQGPVIGATSPQFNMTLGYFASDQGDVEAELPVGGIGVIQLRYDPTLPLPDGILGAIELVPNTATYTESGAY